MTCRKLNTSILINRYGKYKPLTQPAKCTRCSEKRIKSAYHVLCTPCVEELGGVCAKCRGTEEDIVNQPQPTKAEEARLHEELLKEVKRLPERKRRTFLRYLAKQEKGTPKVNFEMLMMFSMPNPSTEISKPPPDPTEESEEAATATEAAPSKCLSEVRQEALAKLKDLTEKYAKDGANGDDFDFDDDLDDLDLYDDLDEDE